MNIYISHMAALRFWRQDGSLRLTKPSRARLLWRAVCSTKDAKSFGLRERSFLYGKESPLDVLVPEPVSRRYANELRPHVWSHELPKGAFRLVSPNVLVSSPEFVFVQLASVLSLAELAQLGNELCGGYYLLDYSGFEERTNHEPLTTKSKILAFVESVGNARGAKKALRALAWVTDHCNSPMETNTLLALCLPRRMGGWSLPLPEVNKGIPVGARLEKYVGGRTYFPDFLWVREIGDKKVYVSAEYDSSEHHDDDEDAEHTRIRRNDMKSMGYLVTSINKSQMKDAKEMQYPARQIARDLGLYRPVPDPETLAKQGRLLTLLSRESFR